MIENTSIEEQIESLIDLVYQSQECGGKRKTWKKDPIWQKLCLFAEQNNVTPDMLKNKMFLQHNDFRSTFAQKINVMYQEGLQYAKGHSTTPNLITYEAKANTNENKNTYKEDTTLNNRYIELAKAFQTIEKQGFKLTFLVSN